MAITDGRVEPAEALAVAVITEADIEQGMARAVATVRLRSRRPTEVMELPNRPEYALASLTAEGWCQVGSIVDHDGGQDWHVWVNVHTGAGRLRRGE